MYVHVKLPEFKDDQEKETGDSNSLFLEGTKKPPRAVGAAFLCYRKVELFQTQLLIEVLVFF